MPIKKSETELNEQYRSPNSEKISSHFEPDIMARDRHSNIIWRRLKIIQGIIDPDGHKKWKFYHILMQVNVYHPNSQKCKNLIRTTSVENINWCFVSASFKFLSL